MFSFFFFLDDDIKMKVFCQSVHNMLPRYFWSLLIVMHIFPVMLNLDLLMTAQFCKNEVYSQLCDGWQRMAKSTPMFTLGCCMSSLSYCCLSLSIFVYLVCLSLSLCLSAGLFSGPCCLLVFDPWQTLFVTNLFWSC